MQNLPNLPNLPSATYAGFWVRFLAFLLDIAIVVLPAVVMLFLSQDRAGIDDATANESLEVLNSYDIYLGMMIISLVYQVACNISKMQATVGKWIFQLKVVNDNGQKISAEQAIGRYFASYISIFLFGIGALMIIWNKRKKSLHDTMAGTMVVKVSRAKGSWL